PIPKPHRVQAIIRFLFRGPSLSRSTSAHLPRYVVTSRYDPLRLGPVTCRDQAGVIDVQVRDRLVDQHEAHLLADDRHLEHLVGENDLRVVPRACRRSDFAIRKALETTATLSAFSNTSRKHRTPHLPGTLIPPGRCLLDRPAERHSPAWRGTLPLPV